jgi:chemotaxis protein methyltransferase CheR
MTIYKKDSRQRAPQEYFPYKPDITGAETSFERDFDLGEQALREVSLPHSSSQADGLRLQPESQERGSPEAQFSPYAEALTLYKQGLYREAAERLITPHANAQNYAEEAILLARSYANIGKLDEALEWCEKAVALNRIDSGSHYLRAIILQEKGVLDEAAVSLKRALYLNQDFVLAHFALGNLARRKGKPKDAVKHYRNALSLSRRYRQDEILPESEGITAGRLTEIIQSTTCTEKQV